MYVTRLITVCLVALFLQSCALNVIRTTEYKEILVKGISVPEIGEISTGEIGDNLFNEFVGTVYIVKTVVLSGAANGEIGKISDKQHYSIASGSSTPKLYALKDNSVKAACFDDVTNYSGNEITVGPTKLWAGREITDLCLIDKEGDGTFESSEAQYTSKLDNEFIASLESGVAYIIESKYTRDIRKKSFERVMLYQGVSNNTIKVSYREYKNSIARDAFTQDVQYELGADGTALIAFKGARIEVLKASNTSITYRVVKPFADSIVL